MKHICKSFTAKMPSSDKEAPPKFRQCPKDGGLTAQIGFSAAQKWTFPNVFTADVQFQEVYSFENPSLFR